VWDNLLTNIISDDRMEWKSGGEAQSVGVFAARKRCQEEEQKKQNEEEERIRKRGRRRANPKLDARRGEEYVGCHTIYHFCEWK